MSQSLAASYEQKLFATDFDGTAFNTSDRVQEAYATAIHAQFGEDAEASFLADGGHNHRTPLEIVYAINPNLSAEQAEQAGTTLTHNKLDILMDLIGTPLADGSIWPRPTAGFVDLWRAVHEAHEDSFIVSAVISAGHTNFISQTFDVHDLPQPDVVISEDVIRNMGLRLPHELQAKPAPLPMELARHLGATIIRSHQVPTNEHDLATVYAGDDLIKDGGLADATGSQFVLVKTDDALSAWQTVAGYLGVTVPVGETERALHA